MAIAGPQQYGYLSTYKSAAGSSSSAGAPAPQAARRQVSQPPSAPVISPGPIGAPSRAPGNSMAPPSLGLNIPQ